MSCPVKGFPGGLNSKESALNMGDPGSGRSLGERNGNLVFFAGEVHGQRSLAGYRSWVCKESDMTDQLTRTQASVTGFSFKVYRLFTAGHCEGR